MQYMNVEADTQGVYFARLFEKACFVSKPRFANKYYHKCKSHDVLIHWFTGLGKNPYPEIGIWRYKTDTQGNVVSDKPEDVFGYTRRLSSRPLGPQSVHSRGRR